MAAVKSRKTRRGPPPVREFNDRGVDWLLDTPPNMRSFLLLAEQALSPFLDFKRMRKVPSKLIPATLRKQEADLIYEVPFRWPDSEGREQEIWILILLEHQSIPDPIMAFHILFYMTLLWDRQRTLWKRENRPMAELRFQPILPIVLYTGTPSWKMPLSLAACMDLPPTMERYVPRFDTLVVNLKEMGNSPENRAARESNPLWWVLNVLQKEDAPPGEFRKALEDALRYLETMPRNDLGTMEQFLEFLLLIVLHRREPEEQGELS